MRSKYWCEKSFDRPPFAHPAPCRSRREVPAARSGVDRFEMVPLAGANSVSASSSIKERYLCRVLG